MVISVKDILILDYYEIQKCENDLFNWNIFLKSTNLYLLKQEHMEQ